MSTDSSDARKESPHTTDIPDPHGEPEFGADPQLEGKVGATSDARADDPITGKPLFSDDDKNLSATARRRRSADAGDDEDQSRR